MLVKVPKNLYPIKDNMETKQKILIGAGAALVLGGGVVLLGGRARGNSLYDQWTIYATDLKIENNADKQADVVLGATIYDLSKKYTGDYKKYIKIEGNVDVSKLVTDFYTAFYGAGTDTALFYSTLYKIKNLYTFAFINKVYEIQYHQTLTDAILGEVKLTGAYDNTKTYGPLSGAIAFTFGIVPTALAVATLSNKLNPQIVAYLSKLPEV